MRKVEVNALRLRYFEQLPTIAAMLVPEQEYNPHDVAEEAIAIVEAICAALEELY